MKYLLCCDEPPEACDRRCVRRLRREIPQLGGVVNDIEEAAMTHWKHRTVRVGACQEERGRASESVSRGLYEATRAPTVLNRVRTGLWAR